MSRLSITRCCAEAICLHDMNAQTQIWNSMDSNPGSRLSDQTLNLLPAWVAPLIRHISP